VIGLKIQNVHGRRGTNLNCCNNKKQSSRRSANITTLRRRYHHTGDKKRGHYTNISEHVLGQTESQRKILTKVDKILKHWIRGGFFIAMDSNASSRTGHDTTTNNRGKHLEEYVINKHMHIMNEP